MGDLNVVLQQKNWRIIDQSHIDNSTDPLQSFAIDDTLCASIGSGDSPATARTWVHDKTIVLGIQDTKLPYLKEGINFLKQQGYHFIVRNSGGLAVVLDEGVLNISLILSETNGRIEINRGYETMLSLIQEMFVDFQKEILAGEIVGSYCPGSYDLSINKKKFAGISQRRLRNGVAVQVYLAVTNSGRKRAQLIRKFYEKSGATKHPTITYPNVNPKVSASLSELLSNTLTIPDVVSRLYTTLKRHSKSLQIAQFTTEENKLFESYFKRILKRNEKALQGVL